MHHMPVMKRNRWINNIFTNVVWDDALRPTVFKCHQSKLDKSCPFYWPIPKLSSRFQDQTGNDINEYL